MAIRRGGVLASLIAGLLAAAAAPAEPLAVVIADYERFTQAHPIETGRSDLPDGSDAWPDERPASLAEQRKGLQALAARLRAVDPASLTADDRTNRDYLDQIIGFRVAGLSFDESRFAFVAHDGFYNLPSYVAQATHLHDPAEARAWIARLRQLPAWFAVQRANLDRGIATGWTQPAQVVDVAISVLTAQVAEAPARSALLAPFDEPIAGLPGAERTQLRGEAEAVVRDAVLPARRALLAYLRTRYRSAARPAIGIDSVPGGRAYYDFLLRYYTTTDLTAEQIHASGEAEVRRIRAEMEALIRGTGFTGSFAEWLAMLRRDPRFYATSREQLVEKASAVAKRIDGVLPRWFGTLPRQPFTVVSVPADVEEHFTTARYSGGDPAKGNPGRFLVNTSHLDQRPLYELPSLALHEAAPGHHTHFALTREHGELPSFRREGDLLVYREGWAL